MMFLHRKHFVFLSHTHAHMRTSFYNKTLPCNVRWIVTPAVPLPSFFEKVSNEDKFVFSSAPPSKPCSCFLQPISRCHYFGLQLMPLAGLTRVSAGCMVMDLPLRMFQISLSGFREESLCPPRMDAKPRGDDGKIFNRALFSLFFLVFFVVSHF